MDSTNTPPGAGLDTPITIKVIFQGASCRSKLPLRDMVPHNLEKHLRSIFSIPSATDITLERYSDSAAAYVRLEPENWPVYKQLYRAAKAKSKIKLRVTVTDQMNREGPSAPRANAESVLRAIPPNQGEKPAIGMADEQPNPSRLAETAPRPTSGLNGANSCSTPSPFYPRRPSAAAVDSWANAPETAGSFDAKTWTPAIRNSIDKINTFTHASSALVSHLNLKREFCGLVESAKEPVHDSSSTGKYPSRALSPSLWMQDCPLSKSSINIQDSHKKQSQQTQQGTHDIANFSDDLVDLATQFGKMPRSREIQMTVNEPPLSVAAASTTTSRLPASTLLNPTRRYPSADSNFHVCCNNCDATIVDVHFHCSNCDDGDFDLCTSCVEQGITCHGADHWLAKRNLVQGKKIVSSTDIAASRRSGQDKAQQKSTLPAVDDKNGEKPVRCVCPSAAVQQTSTAPAASMPRAESRPYEALRTCNCCVQEFPEQDFVHCAVCPDYDLCHPCFDKNAHGHHPNHAFVPAVEESVVPDRIRAKMGPGRNVPHFAICDGCDKYIVGIRHKCLVCPDWDYCSLCVQNARSNHAHHRFVPIFEPLADLEPSTKAMSIHTGIICDGPNCSAAKEARSYIRGVRYKCAICEDVDFCGNCEASPANMHNLTHPLLKIRTPIRHVMVTTTGGLKKSNCTAAGREMESDATIRSVGTTIKSRDANTNLPSMSNPTSEAENPAGAKTDKISPKSTIGQGTSVAISDPKMAIGEDNLRAVFLRDSFKDGTALPPNRVFEQTWILRNEGDVPWPAGCSVKFVAGDYMGHVDSTHPAEVSELASAAESTVCRAPLSPGEEFAFTVRLRTPSRFGKIISYWRLATPNGFKFGHRLWCEVNVCAALPSPEQVAEAAEAVAEENVTMGMKKDEATQAGKKEKGVMNRNDKESGEEAVEEEKEKEEEEKASEKKQLDVDEGTDSSSMMIFPKLEKESLDATAGRAEMAAEKATSETETLKYTDESGDEDWEASEGGFLTDEEYDILDASDEDFLEEATQKLSVKS